ncbi:MAG: bifunctional precorrin-2 dehydrogenase/sirohydrochlorin ferrochelatase [Firmicutes bacterium]|nr:bifunctional precorrin-2 dehydrogenase/sirohydrochlorin ferrochelatase [Bacillota bacterium]
MFYPIMLNLKEKNITVIGGGKVALRKVKTLLRYKANIKVISPKFIDGFKELENQIELIKEKIDVRYLKDSFLVVAATSNKKVNKEIKNYCKVNNILCNVVDDIDLSDFIVPSSIKRGNLVISISTLGKSPSLASKIRKDLEFKYTKDYSEYVDILGDIRNIVLRKCEDKQKRKKILNELVYLDLYELKKRRELYEGYTRI